MTEPIQPIVMPKWGLAMQEGMVAAWHVEAGTTIARGQEIMDIETSKIANVFESPAAGKLRRRVVEAGETVPVGALLGVVAEDAVGDAELDSFIADHQARLAELLAARASEAGPEPQQVEAAGRRIRYLEVGDALGPPVVFLHGYGGDLNNWMFNQPAIAARRKTYALDLPGHGGSSKEVGPGDLPTMARATLAWMEALRVGKAYLVGHSMGGAVALWLALEQPDRVAGATLICPAGLGPEVEMAYIDGFLQANRRKKMEPVLQMLVANPEIVTGEMIEDVLKFKRLDGVDAALRQLRDGLFPGGRQATGLRDRLGELKVPVQVVWGAEDRIIPVRHGEGLPGRIRLSVLPAAGHLAHMEKAGEVNDLILAALDG